MSAYASHIASIGVTPQTEKAKENQILNDAGGFVFAVSDESRLNRFLILGSERNTFYAAAKDRTCENSAVISKMIKEGFGKKVIDLIVEISTKGKSRKNDQLIFALLQVFVEGDDSLKQFVTYAFPKVIRTGTHLFFAHELLKQYVKAGVVGWGNKVKNLIKSFYNQEDVASLAFQMIKYRNREGWCWKDSLRLNHIKPIGDAEPLFKYVVKGIIPEVWPKTLRKIEGFEAANKATNEAQLVALIKEYNLQEEMIPTTFRKSIKVQEALLDTMGLTAIIRHLGSFTASRMLSADNIDNICKVEEKLANVDLLKKAKIHPLFVLDAMLTYSTGQGLKGSLTWKPVQRIVSALDKCYYKTFDFIEPTGKKIMFAIDVSGSMGWSRATNVLTAREASVALAMTFLKTETKYYVKGFSDTFLDLNISGDMTLKSAINRVSGIAFQATDCSLPMVYATENKLDVDAFVIFTDNETYVGNIHPFEALKKYRKAMGKPDAKLIVIATEASAFSIADPSDKGMLDIVGFSTDCGAIVSEFIKGEV